MTDINKDLVQVVRLALSEQTEDVRLFVARLVRKYRATDPELSEQMDVQLKTNAPRSQTLMRKVTPQFDQPVPTDDQSGLSLLKVYKGEEGIETPMLASGIQEKIEQLIQERLQKDLLASLGLQPTKSAIFVGKPGVGKTVTARWLAAQLQVPLYILDLTAVMSSLLGHSGNNLRAALDFAKRSPCILLLDEIDAIAKSRNDDSDVGELKRLVTVILQEVDEWPSTGLLLAATNHPELIDRALWRRFDLLVEFGVPNISMVKDAIKRFLSADISLFERWLDILVFVFQGYSFSDIERDIQRFRRAVALGMSSDTQLIEDLIKSRVFELDHSSRIELAVELAKQGVFTQHNIHALTGVSRDTIRKYSNSSSEKIQSSRRKSST
ncbi:ATP-binding protein [Cellvibrio sp. NN19]|uniref:AAA family ATPase n=1 Tax=Cellvibrio chitinivorans TaxID=3102792 RepID=UPI002B40DD93|nr:ATP-binding protein [Cellvibrio sp. NN19]